MLLLRQEECTDPRWCADDVLNCTVTRTPWACLSTTQLRLHPHHSSHITGRDGSSFFLCFFLIRSPDDGWCPLPLLLSLKAQPGWRTQITTRKHKLILLRLPRPHATSHSFFTFDFSSKSLIINKCSVNVAITASSLGLDFLQHPGFTITATGKKVQVDGVRESNQSHVQSECVYTKLNVTASALQCRKKQNNKKNILHFRKRLKDY